MRETIGKFQIQRLLGHGSMGEVYLALDATLGREVAIKLIIPGNAFGAESRARFQLEARAMAALNHPNIVTLFEAGVEAGVDYLVMEYLDGEDLTSLIGQRKLARAQLLEALAQACEGLAYAHSRGVVHRDVKPGNILVASWGGRFMAKLMDFGIAALGQGASAEPEGRVGTVGYMAPEYLETGQATPSADLFAAGVILYEILASGRKPFAGESATAVLAATLRQEPAPLEPREFAEVPAGLLDVAVRALAKRPGDRYPTADALAAAIRAALAAPPALPRPAAAGPVVVGKGGRATCLSLRVALRQVQPGGVIQVLPGLYPEPILVDRPVTVQGDGDAAEVVFQGGITVAPGATLTLVEATAGNGLGAAVRLLPGARIEARDACFQGGAAGGVELGSGTEGSFLRCRFTGNGSAGMLALEGAQAFLEDCELSGNQDAGIHVCLGASIQLRACRLVANQGLGVSVVDGGAVALDRCEVARNLGPGVQLHRGGSARLEHCQVGAGPSLGIACRQGAALTLGDCQVQGNALGGILLGQGAPAPDLGPDNRIADQVIKETWAELTGP